MYLLLNYKLFSIPFSEETRRSSCSGTGSAPTICSPCHGHTEEGDSKVHWGGPGTKAHLIHLKCYLANILVSHKVSQFLKFFKSLLFNIFFKLNLTKQNAKESSLYFIFTHLPQFQVRVCEMAPTSAPSPHSTNLFLKLMLKNGKTAGARPKSPTGLIIESNLI